MIDPNSPDETMTEGGVFATIGLILVIGAIICKLSGKRKKAAAAKSAHSDTTQIS